MLGRFITIEGIDGAGKSTQTESLLKHLADQGVSVLHTREPGGTPLAEKIRAMQLMPIKWAARDFPARKSRRLRTGRSAVLRPI